MVEQQFCKLEVRSSTLRSPFGVCSSIGRAMFCGSIGCGFESHQTPYFFSLCLQLNWIKRRIANSKTKGSSPFKHEFLYFYFVWVAQRQSGGLKSLRSVVRSYFQTVQTGVASIVAMRWIANPCQSGSIPLPPLIILLCERDGMVDMSGLDSGDNCRVGSSPAARNLQFLECTLGRFF